MLGLQTGIQLLLSGPSLRKFQLYALPAPPALDLQHLQWRAHQATFARQDLLLKLSVSKGTFVELHQPRLYVLLETTVSLGRRFKQPVPQHSIALPPR